MPDGKLQVIELGIDLLTGETYQVVVPVGCWFASRPVGEFGFSLVGCTVALGFDFADFEMGNQAEMIKIYPQHELLILQLARLIAAQILTGLLW